MFEVIVVAPPAAHGLAQKLAAELSALGVSADAPDLSAQWTEDKWRGMASSWPEGAFIAFCLGDEFADDGIMNDLIWRLTPIDTDSTGRFLFVFFDPALTAAAKFKTFTDLHFAAFSDDAADAADHVKNYRQPMNDVLKAAEARRRAQAERPAVLREPGPRPASPRDIGGAEGIGAAAPPLRRPPGVGAGYSDGPPKVGGERKPTGFDVIFQPAPTPAAPSAPAPSPAASAPEALKPTLPAASAPDLPSLSAPPAARAPASQDVSGYERGRRSAEYSEDSNNSYSAGSTASASTAYRYSAAKKIKAPRPVKLDKVDSMAFAPKKLRRGTPELIRVAIFQPKDRGRAQKAAKQADARTQSAGVQSLGQIERGAAVSAVLDARGVDAEITRLDAEWLGEPIDFNFPVEPLEDVAQALITIRILVDDAQVGAITFARPIIKARKDGRASKLDSREKLRRVNRVFLSYSSNDRTPVSLIASAYQRAGVPCFFDRTSLKSGEEWSPRLRSEIERADLFHLCWSRSASGSEWVEKETSHAMTKRKKTGGRKPDITIQMLDGPPWAPHPQSLDALNFDDYARAAIVGYARGDGA